MAKAPSITPLQVLHVRHCNPQSVIFYFSMRSIIGRSYLRMVFLFIDIHAFPINGLATYSTRGVSPPVDTSFTHKLPPVDVPQHTYKYNHVHQKGTLLVLSKCPGDTGTAPGTLEALGMNWPTCIQIGAWRMGFLENCGLGYLGYFKTLNLSICIPKIGFLQTWQRTTPADWPSFSGTGGGLSLQL